MQTEAQALKEAHITIQFPNGATYEVLPLEGSYERKAIMEVGILALKWTSTQYQAIPIGARTSYRGTTYTLHTDPKVKKVHSRLYEYDITLEAPEADLARLKFKFPADGRLQFSLTARPQEFLRYIVDNLNERARGTWQYTTALPADTPERTLSFNHQTLIEALKAVCEAFNTEWHMEGSTLSLGAVEFDRNNPIALSYGKGNGLLSGITRTDNGKTAPIGRMYVQTGTRNIPDNYGRKTLKLASGTWQFDGTHFAGEQGYNSQAAVSYRTTADYIELTSAPALAAEASTEDTETYPKRVGSVTEVFTIQRSTRNNTAGQPSQPTTLFDFTDTANSVDYKANIIKGETPKLIFQSGACAGREFEFQYQHEGKRFLIVPLQADGTIFPSETFPIKAGDKYAVFGINLPAQYIKDAETEAAKKAVRTFFKQTQSRITITAEIQSLWFKQQQAKQPLLSRRFRVGAFVAFSDSALSPKPYIIRIKAIKRPLTDPEAPAVELSNEPIQSTTISTIVQDVASLKYAASQPSSTTIINNTTQSIDTAALDSKYLSAVAADVAAGRITFAEGLQSLKQAYFTQGLNIGNAVNGIIAGRGATIDQHGNIEAESITIRGYLRAAEYLLNRIQITEGAQWLTEGGIIESVKDTTRIVSSNTPRTFDITFRSRYEGDTQAPFAKGDIIRGQTTSLRGGDTITTWLRVESVDGLKVSVSKYLDTQTPEGRNGDPTEQMRVARWGNTTNAQRQSHIVLDPQQGQIIRRVNITAPIITPEQTDGFSLGTLPTWLKTQLGGAVDGKSDYLFARGIITQDIIRYTPQGKPIAERVDRGVWSAQQRYYYEAKNTESGVFEISRVWLDGTLYELAPRGNGNTRPSPSNTNWNVVQPAPRNGKDGTNGRDGAKGDKGADGKNGANGLTTQPNILREANLPSNTTAWSRDNNKGGDNRHEPNVAPPINGAEVWSCNATTTAESFAQLFQEVKLIKGKTYTLSVYAKGAQSGWLIGWPIGEHFALVAAKPIEDKNTAEGWQRFAVTFQATQSGITNIYLRSWNQVSQRRSGRVYFAAPKLEESFEPTPWTRAQSDFKGEKGEVGARGAVVRNLGEWEALPSGFAFQSGARGEAYIDAVSVKEGNTLLWWYCKQSHSKGNRPSVNRPEWELGQNLKFVATDILLAQKAFIDNLGVRYVESRNDKGEIAFSVSDKGEVKAKGGTFENIYIAGESRFTKLKAVSEYIEDEAGEISFSERGLNMKGKYLNINSDIFNSDLITDFEPGEFELDPSGRRAWRTNRFHAGLLHVESSFSAKGRTTAVVKNDKIIYYIGGCHHVGEADSARIRSRKEGDAVPAYCSDYRKDIKSGQPIAVDTLIIALDRYEVLKMDMYLTQRIRVINISGFGVTLDLGKGGRCDVNDNVGNSVTLFNIGDLGDKGDKGIWVIH